MAFSPGCRPLPSLPYTMYNIIPLATKAMQYLSSTAQDLQTTYLPSLFPAVDTRPNILIILTDDQDDHMRSLDYMPNVKDHIIDKGAYHSSHYCTIALCCPSRTSLWTGLHGHNHNVTDVGGPYGGLIRDRADLRGLASGRSRGSQ